MYAYIRYKHTTSGPDPMLIKRVYCIQFNRVNVFPSTRTGLQEYVVYVGPECQTS